MRLLRNAKTRKRSARTSQKLSKAIEDVADLEARIDVVKEQLAVLQAGQNSSPAGAGQDSSPAAAGQASSPSESCDSTTVSSSDDDEDEEEVVSEADRVKTLEGALALKTREANTRTAETIALRAKLEALQKRQLPAAVPAAKKRRVDPRALGVPCLAPADVEDLVIRFGVHAFRRVGKEARSILAVTQSLPLAEALLEATASCEPVTDGRASHEIPVGLDLDWEFLDPTTWPESGAVSHEWLGSLSLAIWSVYDFGSNAAQRERDAIVKQLKRYAKARPPSDAVEALSGWLALVRPRLEELEHLRNRLLTPAERALEPTRAEYLPPRIADLRQALQTQKPPAAAPRPHSAAPVAVSTRVPSAKPAAKKGMCSNFRAGRCVFGSKCRYSHAAPARGAGRA